MKHSTSFLSLALASIPLTSCATPTPIQRLGADEATAREAIRQLVSRGDDAIPELRSSLQHDDPLVKSRARTAMGRITGQWGSKGELMWKRSVEQASNPDKPLMVLHLFGNFDEEFC